MTRQEFEAEQHLGRRDALSHLAGECMRLYLRAARLVAFEGPTVKAISEALRGGYDMTPLLGAWCAICKRYRDECFDNQGNLFIQDHAKYAMDRWRTFLFRDLYPRLLEDDEFVRDVLRALMLLPCESSTESQEAVRHKMNVAYIQPIARTRSDP